jgi:long-chain acyl-CoA synthetase
MELEYQTVPELLRGVTAENRDRVAYRYKSEGAWHDVTWSESEATVNAIAKGLIALEVSKGERACILSQTRLEWVQCDLAIATAGAVTVGIYPTLLASDCAYIINHSDAALIFVENREQVDRLLSVRGDLPKIKTIVIYDGDPDPDNGVLSWQEFLERGRSVADDELEARARSVTPEDLAAIVYTSGTSGVPKGAMITHDNMVFTPESAARSLYLLPEFVTLLFLPLAHVFARLIVYFCMMRGLTVAFAESIVKVPDNIREIQPHFFASVPRIYEKFYDKIMTGVEEAGGLKERMFLWALSVGRKVSVLTQRKQPVPALLRLENKIATRLVFKKIHAAFGGRFVWGVSGSAPLNKDIAEFFHSCGILILEGIGMTENTSFSNVNRYDNNKFGTVGPVGPGIEMKLAEDGEILFRGRLVMKGYFKNEEATAEAIDSEGWLHTGDVGEIDEDGFLKITDRKTDLIKTSGGKFIAPQRIERILRTSHFISQVVAVGDRRKFITALITLDAENLPGWAKQKGIAFETMVDLAGDPQVEQLIRSEIEERNKQLASFESVKKFRIVPGDFSIEEGELTPSFKIKRKAVIKKHESLIESMYRE